MHKIAKKTGQSLYSILYSHFHRNVRQKVGSRHKNGGGRKLGLPSDKEARDMLVKTRGNENEACVNIASEREKKVRLLLQQCGGLYSTQL